MIGSWIEFCPPQAVIVSSIEVWNFKNQYWYPGIFSPHVKNNRYFFPLLIHIDTVFKKYTNNPRYLIVVFHDLITM